MNDNVLYHTLSWNMTGKLQIINSAIENARNFQFCGPSDDPDEQSAVTIGFRYLIIQIKRLVSPLLPEQAASRLNAIDVDPHDLYSAFDAKAELDTLLPDIENAVKKLRVPENETMSAIEAKPLPVPVCSIIGDVLGNFYYHHKTLENIFYEAGATGEVPLGNCVKKSQAWLKRMHEDVTDPAAVLGKILEEYMEVDRDPVLETQQSGRTKIREVLGRFALSYHTGGIILGAVSALPTKSLHQILKDRDLAGVDKEFDRALANVEIDPPAAVTAACSILESLFKVYLEDNGIKMPADQSLKPLWKSASKNLGLDPAGIEDEDLKKVLSGLNSIVDGIGSFRTHTGSAHGRGRRPYKPQARHARLTIHASHTLVAFFIETWDERKQKAMS